MKARKGRERALRGAAALAAALFVIHLSSCDNSFTAGSDNQPEEASSDDPGGEEESPVENPYVAEIARAADYIIASQNSDGAIPDAHDSDWFNVDNSMGYALMGLHAAYRATGDAKYLEAVRRALAWQASVQDAEGSWYVAYKKCGAASYCPALPQTGPGITAAKTVDAIQAFFTYNLWLYLMNGGDSAFVQTYRSAARHGIDRLIAMNRDENGRFFYSSWHQIDGVWKRYNFKYTMGQGDVYLGLMAAWRLLGDEAYREAAEAIREDFDAVFWDEANGRYPIGVNADDSIDDEEYILAQAIPTFFLRNTSAHAGEALTYLKDHRLPSGAIDPEESGEQATLDVAGLALAAAVLGDEETAASAQEYVASMQVVSETVTDGAIKYDTTRSNDNTSNLYIGVTGFGILALCGEACDVSFEED